MENTQRKKLLYIHGYNGSPEGSSCRLFRKYVSEEAVAMICRPYCTERK